MVGHVFWPWSTFVYNFTTLNIFSKDQRAMPVQDDESMFLFLWNQSQDTGYVGYVLDLLSKVKMSGVFTRLPHHHCYGWNSAFTQLISICLIQSIGHTRKSRDLKRKAHKFHGNQEYILLVNGAQVCVLNYSRQFPTRVIARHIQKQNQSPTTNWPLTAIRSKTNHNDSRHCLPISHPSPNKLRLFLLLLHTWVIKRKVITIITHPRMLTETLGWWNGKSGVSKKYIHVFQRLDNENLYANSVHNIISTRKPCLFRQSIMGKLWQSLLYPTPALGTKKPNPTFNGLQKSFTTFLFPMDIIHPSCTKRLWPPLRKRSCTISCEFARTMCGPAMDVCLNLDRWKLLHVISKLAWTVA